MTSTLAETRIFETTRLFCRPFTPKDAEALYQLHATPEVGNITIDGVQNREQAEDTLNHFIQHQNTYGYSQWMAFEKESNVFIGRIGFEFRQIDASRPPQTEIRYAYFPTYWGKGYATELAFAAMDWLIEAKRPEMIVATANPSNTVSHHILAKLGMHHEKTFEWRTKPIAFFLVSQNDYLVLRQSESQVIN